MAASPSGRPTTAKPAELFQIRKESSMGDSFKPDAADNAGLLEGDSLKKLLMAKVRAQGGTKAIDSKSLFQSLVQQSLEAFLELEMEEHLGYQKHDPAGRGSGNSRNGHGAKTVRGDFGEVR